MISYRFFVVKVRKINNFAKSLDFFPLLWYNDNDVRIWRNWQTRMVQVHVKAISWRFKSSYPHQLKTSRFLSTLRFLLYTHKNIDQIP